MQLSTNENLFSHWFIKVDIGLKLTKGQSFNMPFKLKGTFQVLGVKCSIFKVLSRNYFICWQMWVGPLMPFGLCGYLGNHCLIIELNFVNCN